MSVLNRGTKSILRTLKIKLLFVLYFLFFSICCYSETIILDGKICKALLLVEEELKNTRYDLEKFNVVISYSESEVVFDLVLNSDTIKSLRDNYSEGNEKQIIVDIKTMKIVRVEEHKQVSTWSEE